MRTDIKAGSAFVELFVKDGRLIRGLRAAQARLQAFGRSLTMIGGVIAAAGASILTPLSLAFKHFIDFGSELTDVSQRTGVASSSLAELAYVAEQSGTSLADVERALAFMAKNGLDPRRFDEIADRIADIEDPVKRAQQAFAVWGKSSTMLLPMLADLKALRAEARALGIVFTPEQIAAADALGDTIGAIRTSVLASVFQVGAALEPMLTPILETVKGIAIGIGKFARENAGLVRILAVVGVVLLAVGTALIAMGVTVLSLVGAIGGLIAAISAIAAAPVTAAIIAIVAALAAVIYSIYAAIAALLVFTERGRAALAYLGKVVESLAKPWRKLGDAIKTTFGAMGEAIKAGELEKAWTIAVKGMEAVWHEFAVVVLDTLGKIADALVVLSPIVGLTAGDEIHGLIDDLSKAESGAAKVNRMEIERLRTATSQGGRPEDYPLPERGAAVIGFNARSALMSRQIIGGGRNALLDTVKSLLTLEGKALKELTDINRKTGGARFR